MDQAEIESHLSRIETHWTAVVRAHRDPGDGAVEARALLLERYGGAVRRYLLASLRDVDAADDLAQEFALRFLRGDFKNADPGRGRFRDFLKRAVYHLMIDYHRARRTTPKLLGDDAPEPAAAGDDADAWADDLDRQFLESWREQLMAHAWAALEKVQERTGQPFAAVLRLRVACPELRSPQLAEQLSQRLGRPVNAGWVRLNLHRARDLFVESLLGQVEHSLGTHSPERLEQELIELGLFEYCRSALRHRGP
ncbi:MAG TPA: sigma factor [Isosphaeraceae bacterium]|nr:sigma factor [Isosphaeraceae bacterium]